MSACLSINNFPLILLRQCKYTTTVKMRTIDTYALTMYEDSIKVDVLLLNIQEIVSTLPIKTNSYFVSIYFYLTQLRKVAVWMLTIVATERKKSSFKSLLSRKYRMHFFTSLKWSISLF